MSGRQREADGAAWHPFASGDSIGQTGSEEGIILRDEEHVDGARITLERDGRISSFAITCGVYGWMVHTRFFSTLESALQAFEEMKCALTSVVGLIPLTTDPELEEKQQRVSEAIHDYVERFP